MFNTITLNTCYNCTQFGQNGNIPWCKILDKETNALAPVCELKKICAIRPLNL